MLKNLALLVTLSTVALAQESATPPAGADGAHPQRAPVRAKTLTNVEFDATK